MDQQIKLFFHNIHKNNNTSNNDNTKKITVCNRNQIQYDYKLDVQAKTNIKKDTLNLSKNKNKLNLSSTILKFRIISNF